MDFDAARKKVYCDDRMGYYKRFSKAWFLDVALQSEQYWLRRFTSNLRQLEKSYNNRLLRWYFLRQHNRLSVKLGFFINPFNFDEGLKIYHYGSIIVHPNARIGRNCTIHGNCCIGTTGGGDQSAPVIGNNVDIGQGAQVLGGIFIANNIKIAAGAVVVKSVTEEGVTLIGVPAHVLTGRTRHVPALSL